MTGRPIPEAVKNRPHMATMAEAANLGHLGLRCPPWVPYPYVTSYEVANNHPK